MTTYAERTDVPVARSRAEIDGLLKAWGANSIRWTDEFREGVVVLEFVWTHEGLEYLARFSMSLAHDDSLREQSRNARSGRVSESKLERLRAGRGRSEHRLLLLWLRAAFHAVAAGLVRAETLFLPFLVGRDGQTFGDAAIPRLRELLRGPASNILPAAASGRPS